jgi:hypothetical protein
VGDADHQFVEDVRRTANQIFVSPGHGIKRAGIDRDDHTSSLICSLPALHGPPRQPAGPVWALRRERYNSGVV